MRAGGCKARGVQAHHGVKGRAFGGHNCIRAYGLNSTGAVRMGVIKAQGFMLFTGLRIRVFGCT